MKTRTTQIASNTYCSDLMRSRSRILLVVGLCASLASLSGCDRISLGTSSSQESLKFTTEYQAVFMANGQVFFGKLEGAGTDWPLLRDVYTIQSQMNPETKQMASALVRRSNDLHGPDHMLLNARQIALIEPVGAASRVGQLISQAKADMPPTLSTPAASQN